MFIQVKNANILIDCTIPKFYDKEKMDYYSKKNAQYAILIIIKML